MGALDCAHEIGYERYTVNYYETYVGEINNLNDT